MDFGSVLLCIKETGKILCKQPNGAAIFDPKLLRWKVLDLLFVEVVFFLMMHVIYRRAYSTDALRASTRELRSRALLLHVSLVC